MGRRVVCRAFQRVLDHSASIFTRMLLAGAFRSSPTSGCSHQASTRAPSRNSPHVPHRSALPDWCPRRSRSAPSTDAAICACYAVLKREFDRCSQILRPAIRSTSSANLPLGRFRGRSRRVAVVNSGSSSERICGMARDTSVTGRRAVGTISSLPSSLRSSLRPSSRSFSPPPCAASSSPPSLGFSGHLAAGSKPASRLASLR